MDVHRNVKYEARILAKEIMNSKLNRLNIVAVCGTALLIAAAVAVVVALRNRQQPALPPDAPVAALPAEVRVKAVERKPEPPDYEVVEASSAVAIVCGADPTTADRYEARTTRLGRLRGGAICQKRMSPRLWRICAQRTTRCAMSALRHSRTT